MLHQLCQSDENKQNFNRLTQNGSAFKGDLEDFIAQQQRQVKHTSISNRLHKQQNRSIILQI